MTVGESLTQARRRAGLSVDELSERTRIRGTVIRSIERDDYAACGGDLYVRGYVRAIAGAVGIDAQPLIREYDLARGNDTAPVAARPAPADPAATSLDLPAAAGAGPADPGVTSLDLPAAGGPVRADPAAAPLQARDVPGGPGAGGPAAADATRFDLPAVTAEAEATRFDLPAVREPEGEDLMAAGYQIAAQGTAAPAGPAVPGQQVPAGGGAGSGAGRPARRGGRLLTVAGAVLVLAAAGVAGVHLATAGSRSRSAAATGLPRPATPSAAPGGAANGASASAGASVPVTSVTSPQQGKTARSATAPQANTRPPVTVLPVAAAEAFGPDGLSDGDNPQIAHWAIDPAATQPWTTQWYATAQFGMLKHGTGLLLDLGRRVNVTSVRVSLTSYTGADLQLRVGDGTAPRDLRVVAAASDTGGVVRITPGHPAAGRYLLIWFTLLPPNGMGQYQESVYHVLVRGWR